jgi:ABC-type molybdenum transport system, ATPase component/photorepair protein PhrA
MPAPPEHSPGSAPPALRNAPASSALPELPRHRPGLPLVQIDRASLRLGDTLALDALSLSLYRNGHTALVGPNGAGKSTLLKLIGAELRLSQVEARPEQSPAQATPLLPEEERNGSILWGFSGRLLPHALEAKKHVRLVSPWQQGEYRRQEWKITGEEIALSGYANSALLYDIPPLARKKAVTALFRQAGLGQLRAMPAPAMSQGQLRACLIIRALAAEPALLLLDEPFDGLDAVACRSLARLMKLAAENSTTLLMTSHRAEDIPPFVRRHLHLDRGRLTVPPFPGEDPELTPVEARAKARPARGKQTGLTPGNAALPGLERLQKKAKRVLPEGRPVFALRNVDVFIDRQKVLHSINWTVNRGEQWRVSGPNGSGKSTLLRLLYGDEFAAWGGDLYRLGRKTLSLPRLRGLVGLVSDRLQQTYAYDLTAHEVVLSGFDGCEGVYRDYSQQEEAQAAAWERQLGLEGLGPLPWPSLSTGQARRVLLARALAAAHPVLLFDEPFSGLDAESRTLCLATLPLLAQNGAQIIFVSHRNDDCLPLFTHELALEQGRVVRCGPL